MIELNNLNKNTNKKVKDKEYTKSLSNISMDSQSKLKIEDSGNNLSSA